MDQTRRALLAAGSAALALASSPARAAPGSEPVQRYPDPAIEIIDPSFEKYRIVDAAVERLATGGRWCEGIVWFGDGRYLVWSDIPNNRMMKWDEETGQVSAFRKPSNFSNGNTRDRQGRLITCEHLTRRITRTEYDGSITVLMDQFDGKPLNSPNDITVKSDGSIWFTDPPFGINGNYIGDQATPESPPNVYRLDPTTRQATVAASDVVRPNGIAFSPDERTLYVVESRGAPNRTIRAYDVVDGGTRLANGRAFIDGGRGNPYAVTCDIDGNLWCSWGMGSDELDGVMVYSSAGKRIGHIHLPETSGNLTFGGRKRNRLFMAASQSIYALYVNTQGAVSHG